MKNQILLFALIISVCFLSIISNAQAPAWLWAKSAGGMSTDDAYSVAVDDFGNTYMAGRFFSPTITFGTITLTNVDNTIYYTCDIFLVKYNTNGNVLWAKSAGGLDKDYANSVAVDASGNIYVAGWFYSPTITFGSTTLTNAGTNDIFLAKYDAGGNVLWAKSAGGTKDDLATSVAVDVSGNIYVAGYFRSSALTFGSTSLTNDSAGSADIFLAKYDANGNALWAKSAGGTGGDVAWSIAVDASGNIYVTGDFGSSITFGSTTLTSAGGKDVFLAKYDANGNVIWAKSAGGAGGAEANSVAVDASGNIYVAGDFDSPTITFGATTFTNADITGNTDDLFLAKYDDNGNVIWAKSADGTDEDVATSVAVDASGNTYLTGYFESSILTFGSYTLTNMGGGNLFLTKYDDNGNVLWVKSAEGIGNVYAYSVAVDVSGNIYEAGGFDSPALTFGSTILTNAGSDDIFLAKLSAYAGINELSNSLNTSVFPNPVTNNITIESPQQAVIEISNIQGQLIKAIATKGNKTSVDVSAFPSGVYFIKVITEKGIEVKKFVKK